MPRGGHQRQSRGHGKFPGSLRRDLGSDFGFRISFVPTIASSLLCSLNFRGGSVRLSRTGQNSHTEK